MSYVLEDDTGEGDAYRAGEVEMGGNAATTWDTSTGVAGRGVSSPYR